MYKVSNKGSPKITGAVNTLFTRPSPVALVEKVTGRDVFLAAISGPLGSYNNICEAL